jgi:UDP-GlcNAc3NAcA epimerase
VHVGDVMLDAAIEARRRANALAAGGRDILAALGLSRGGHAVMTLHRAESTKDAATLAGLIGACVAEAAGRPIVFPVHPRTHIAIERAGLKLSSSIRRIGPVGYLDMARLVSTADLVLTDSGGLQKEAYFHRVPCVTLRSETEWPETVAAGWNRLWTGPGYASRREIPEYGDGRAAAASVAAIRAFLERRSELRDAPASRDRPTAPVKSLFAGLLGGDQAMPPRARDISVPRDARSSQPASALAAEPVSGTA